MTDITLVPTELTTCQRIFLGEKDSGLTVRQTTAGTIVRDVHSGDEIRLPHKRYALSMPRGVSTQGVPARDQFDKDLLQAVADNPKP